MTFAWVEEAQTLSARSLALLRPTIRADGSELWFTWNPRRKSDAVDEFLRAATLQNAIVVKANFLDNPFFPGALEEEMQLDRERYPDRFAVMGRIPLKDPKSAELLPKWKEQPGMLGVRVTFLGAAAPWLTDGTADWFWPAAEKAGLPVMFLTAGRTAEFARIAERHPQLVLIVDHMGVVGDVVRAGKLPDAIDQTLSLAKYPNVSVKLSAAPNNSTEAYPFDDFVPHIRRLVDVYGPRRCYWGTDITNGFAKATYKQRITHFTEELAFLSEDDKDWIMGRAILARLGWT